MANWNALQGDDDKEKKGIGISSN
jgi:hypothetical protein